VGVIVGVEMSVAVGSATAGCKAEGNTQANETRSNAVSEANIRRWREVANRIVIGNSLSEK